MGIIEIVDIMSIRTDHTYGLFHSENLTKKKRLKETMKNIK